MAILNLNFVRLHSALCQESSLEKRGKVAFLGYPDLLVSEQILLDSLGENNFKKISIDSRDDDIRKHHGYPDSFKIYSLIDIFDKIYNCDYVIFDVNNVRGIETYLNLNENLPDEYKNQFDVVIDASVLEHCFNIGIAFKNFCDLVKIGGIASTVNPIYMFNHGYYNINPIMIRDGFVSNGFTILNREVMLMNGDQVTSFGRKSNPIRHFNLFLAKRIIEKDFTFPIQTSKK